MSDAARERLIAARETDTVLTSLFDRMTGQPWPSRFRISGMARSSCYASEPPNS